MQFNNRSFISGYDNLHIDFQENLCIKDSIIFKNCNNLEVRINSKINKLIFKNCNNVSLKCSATVCGIDIEKCLDFILIPLDPYNLKLIEIYKSKIDFLLDKKFNFSNTSFDNQLSIINLKRIN